MREFGDEPFDNDNEWIPDDPRPETNFSRAVRQVFTDAEPDEDGIVSISLADVLDRAVAKMRAAAADSSARS